MQSFSTHPTCHHMLVYTMPSYSIVILLSDRPVVMNNHCLSIIAYVFCFTLSKVHIVIITLTMIMQISCLLTTYLNIIFVLYLKKNFVSVNEIININTA